MLRNSSRSKKNIGALSRSAKPVLAKKNPLLVQLGALKLAPKELRVVRAWAKRLKVTPDKELVGDLRYARSTAIEFFKSTSKQLGKSGAQEIIARFRQYPANEAWAITGPSAREKRVVSEWIVGNMTKKQALDEIFALTFESLFRDKYNELDPNIGQARGI